MAQTFLKPPPDHASGPKQVGLHETSTGSIHRADSVICDPDDLAAVAKVTNTTPGVTDYGLLVRAVGTQIVRPLDSVGANNWDGYSDTPSSSNVLASTTTALDALVIAHVGGPSSSPVRVTIQDGTGRKIADVRVEPENPPVVLANLSGMRLLNGVVAVVDVTGLVTVWGKGRQ